MASLSEIWEQTKKDKEAAKAIKVLKRAGLDLDDDERPVWRAILKQEGLGLRTIWRDIAVIPLLPDGRSRSRALPLPGGARAMVRFLREVEGAARQPYCELQVRDECGTTYFGRGAVKELLQSGRLANALEKAIRCRWVVTEHNARQNAVAALCWEVKERTRRAHDRELFDMLYAVFKAAGKPFPWPGSIDAFRKSVEHELEVRQAGARKFSQ